MPDILPPFDAVIIQEERIRVTGGYPKTRTVMRGLSEIRSNGTFAWIKLNSDMYAIIDSIDVDIISNAKWYADKRGHTFYGRTRRDKKLVYLHKEICGAIEIDHVDGNGLNNIRKNLRPCTHSQNMQNAKIQTNNTSGYKGVSYDKNAKKWAARITSCGVQYYLGVFDSIESAYAAYCTKTQQLNGEFARTK